MGFLSEDSKRGYVLYPKRHENEHLQSYYNKCLEEIAVILLAKRRK
jgi:hypothetical protein